MNHLVQLHSNPGARKKRKTVGRGNGSGHGSYSTRGGKGQTARTGSGYKPGFEGGQTPLYRRMPKLKGFNNPNHISFQTVNVNALNVFENGDEVDIVKLFEKKMISSKNKPVKILGDGELTKKLYVKADRFSKSAKLKIEKSEGKIMELMQRTKNPSTSELDSVTK